MPISITIDKSVECYLVDHGIDTEKLDAIIAVIKHQSTITKGEFVAKIHYTFKVGFQAVFTHRERPHEWPADCVLPLTGMPMSVAFARFARDVHATFTS